MLIIIPVFKIESAEIICDEVVKLLGIDIDYQLNFNYHIKNICRKAFQQLNVLKRIGCFLSKLNKLTICHTSTKSGKQNGESLFKVLKHSIAMVRILLTFRDGTLAFPNM
jgi:hypothetical protein